MSLVFSQSRLFSLFNQTGEKSVMVHVYTIGRFGVSGAFALTLNGVAIGVVALFHSSIDQTGGKPIMKMHGPFGVLAMLSPNCGIEFGNMSDSTFETGNVRKIPMLKTKRMFGNDRSLQK